MEKEPQLELGETNIDLLNLNEVINSHIRKVLKINKYHLALTAKTLGISRPTLYRRMAKYGIVNRKKHDQ